MKVWIEQKKKEWVEQTLSKFPYVEWDRFIPAIEERSRSINVFGWINREKDAYKDFVLLHLNLNDERVQFIGTSSKDYSARIAATVGTEHVDCERIEKTFNIKNMIKLEVF